MSDLRVRADGILERLAASPDVVGAALITRDGLPVLSRFAHAVDMQTLGAMSAAALAAVETAGMELGTDTISRLTANAATLHILVEGVDDRHILVAATRSDDSGPLKTVRSAGDELRTLLVG